MPKASSVSKSYVLNVNIKRFFYISLKLAAFRAHRGTLIRPLNVKNAECWYRNIKVFFSNNCSFKKQHNPKKYPKVPIFFAKFSHPSERGKLQPRPFKAPIKTESNYQYSEKEFWDWEILRNILLQEYSPLTSMSDSQFKLQVAFAKVFYDVISYVIDSANILFGIVLIVWVKTLSRQAGVSLGKLCCKD